MVSRADTFTAKMDIDAGSVHRMVNIILDWV